MPSGPPELHEKWCKFGPYESGDLNAQKYLQDRGFRLTRQWMWLKPNREVTQEENEAVGYLCMEWDFGGIIGNV